MSRPLPLGVVSVKCHFACDLMSGWKNHFTSIPEWKWKLRTCICKTCCKKVSSVLKKAKFASSLQLIRPHRYSYYYSGEDCTTVQRLSGISGKLPPHRGWCQVSKAHILYWKIRTTPSGSPSRLRSCSRDFVIRFPSHLGVIHSTNHDSVNTFSLCNTQRALRIIKGQYPCSLKFPHISLCLCLATMETKFFLLTIQKMFFLLRCLNARSKKDDLGFSSSSLLASFPSSHLPLNPTLAFSPPLCPTPHSTPYLLHAL